MVKKKDDKYECGEWGLIVVVDNPCGCSPCDLMCCGVPMEEKKNQEIDVYESSQQSEYI